MCGIIGAVIKNNDTMSLTLLSRLFQQSRIRGMQSYGWATSREMKPRIGSLREAHCAILKLQSGTNFIGHCRYSTSGETPQPLYLKRYPEIVMAFNGNISMKTKPEIEAAYKIKMETDNDGEVFIHYIISGGYSLLIQDPFVSFAGVWLQNNHLWVLRNERRPGWSCTFNGNFFIASTKDIFLRAGFQNPTEIKAYECNSVS